VEPTTWSEGVETNKSPLKGRDKSDSSIARKPHQQNKEETAKDSTSSTTTTTTTTSTTEPQEKSQEEKKWEIDRKRMVARRKRLEAKGVNLSAINTGIDKLKRWDGKSTQHPDPPRTYYIVRNGREIGAFKTWKECQKLTQDYKGAKYKKMELSEREVIIIFEEALDLLPDTKT